MTSISAPIATTCFTVLLFAATLPAQTSDGAAPSNEVSKVRIVRLSEVKGEVQVDRDTGRGFERAMANLPIVEKSRLQTGTGVAEVEFEDNSTLRLAPDSLLEFTQLERLQAGPTVSSVHLVKGIAYVSLEKTKGNEFNLLFGQQNLQIPPSSHIRLQVDGGEAKLAVLDGTVHINGASGPIDVAKKKTVTFSMVDQDQPKIAKDVASVPFDSWDQDAAGYHARTSAFNGSSSSPYAYGLNDMSYYGSFMNAGGCGSMWRPYFASAAWDPYSNGAWAWYQGAGYSWVSPYPWGWTPYHYGSWSFCQGTGWGWQPGGTWNGLNNLMDAASTGGSGHVPLRPVGPPRLGEPTLTLVNQKPLVLSEVSSADSFVFRRDSAGMGIPRDGLGKLDKLSQRAVDRGSATTPIYMNVPATASANGRPTNSAMPATSLHRGSAPSSTAPTAYTAETSSQMGSPNSGGGRPSSSGPAPSSGHSH